LCSGAEGLESLRRYGSDGSKERQGKEHSKWHNLDVRIMTSYQDNFEL
jgi:hypothetical protein